MNTLQIMGERLMRVAAVLALASLVQIGNSYTTVNPNLSIEQMSKASDEIVVGNVVGQNTRLVGSTFETDFEIQVSENLKSTTGELPQGKNFTLTLPGGAIQEPPLSQYVMGTPYMFNGEEVVLFLKKGSGKEVRLPQRALDAGQVSKLTTTFQVVGNYQGRFDVVTRADTGEKVVTRLNLENYGVVADSPAVQKAIKAIAENRIPTVVGQVARQADAAAEARDKDPLEFTASDGKKIKVEQAMQQAQTMKERRKRGLTVQDFEQFKAQVKSSVNTY